MEVLEKDHRWQPREMHEQVRIEIQWEDSTVKAKKRKGSDVGKIVLLEKIIVHCETVIEIKRAILVSTL